MRANDSSVFQPSVISLIRSKTLKLTSFPPYYPLIWQTILHHNQTLATRHIHVQCERVVSDDSVILSICLSVVNFEHLTCRYLAPAASALVELRAARLSTDGWRPSCADCGLSVCRRRSAGMEAWITHSTDCIPKRYGRECNSCKRGRGRAYLLYSCLKTGTLHESCLGRCVFYIGHAYSGWTKAIFIVLDNEKGLCQPHAYIIDISK